MGGYLFADPENFSLFSNTILVCDVCVCVCVGVEKWGLAYPSLFHVVLEKGAFFLFFLAVVLFLA